MILITIIIKIINNKSKIIKTKEEDFAETTQTRIALHSLQQHLYKELEETEDPQINVPLLKKVA